MIFESSFWFFFVPWEDIEVMVYLILKEDFSEVVMARAGHDPPMVYRAADRSVEELAPPGLAVGVDEGPAFERVTSDLSISKPIVLQNIWEVTPWDTVRATEVAACSMQPLRLAV